VSEDYAPVDEAALRMFNTLTGAVDGARYGLDTFEYAMVPVDELNAYAVDRWRVVPVPPSQEITQGLSGPRAGPLMFLMERPVIVRDDIPILDNDEAEGGRF